MTTTNAKNAVWLDSDIEHFIDYLIEHKAQAGDNVNFKISVFRGAAIDMEDHSSCGKAKDANCCKNKYRNVSARFLWARLPADTVIASFHL
jgi:hypothetical protein